MSESFTITEVDAEGQVTERDMTKEEIALKVADRERIAALTAQIAEKEILRQSRREKLLALGLTEEELDA